MEVGSPLGVLDQPRGITNQVDIGVLLTIGTQASQISEQFGDSHALDVRYEVIHDVGRKKDPIHILGDHVSEMVQS